MAATQFDRILQIVEAPDREMDLAEAALLLAKEDQYPDLDVSGYLERIAALARAIGRRLPEETRLGDAIFAINEYLFDDQGFSGKKEDLSDHRAYFLNDVIDHHHGTSATLAILYVAVGRCLGLPLQCIVLPGYFLVKFPQGEGSVIIDPYRGGMVLDPLAVGATLARLYGEDVPESYRPALLSPAGKRDVILRILRTLKDTYLQKQRFDKALWSVDYLLRIAPEQAHEVRERGLLYERLQYTRGAVADYQRYLDLTPDAKDSAEIRRRLRLLERKAAYLH